MIIRVLPILAFGVFVIALQCALGDSWRLVGSAPPLPALLVVYAALWCPRRDAFIVAGALGMLVDTVSIDPPGANTLPFLLAARGIGRAVEARWTERGLARSLVVVVHLGILVLLRSAIAWLVDGVSPTLPGSGAALAVAWLWAWPATSAYRLVARAFPGRPGWSV